MGVGDVSYEVLVVSALILSLVLHRMWHKGPGFPSWSGPGGLVCLGDRYRNKIKIDDPQEFPVSFWGYEVC